MPVGLREDRHVQASLLPRNTVRTSQLRTTKMLAGSNIRYSTERWFVAQPEHCKLQPIRSQVRLCFCLYDVGRHLHVFLLEKKESRECTGRLFSWCPQSESSNDCSQDTACYGSSKIGNCAIYTIPEKDTTRTEEASPQISTYRLHANNHSCP